MRTLRRCIALSYSSLALSFLDVLEQSPRLRVGSCYVTSGPLTADLFTRRETDPFKKGRATKGGFQLPVVCFQSISRLSILLSPLVLASVFALPLSLTPVIFLTSVMYVGVVNIPNKQQRPGA